MLFIHVKKKSLFVKYGIMMLRERANRSGIDSPFVKNIAYLPWEFADLNRPVAQGKKGGYECKRDPVEGKM